MSESVTLIISNIAFISQTLTSKDASETAKQLNEEKQLVRTSLISCNFCTSKNGASTRKQKKS